MADGIANARLLLLVNYRPEYRHQWAKKSYYSQLRLEPLGEKSTSDILAALLGESAGLDALKHLMIQRTQGNPFFIEEMVQALFDEGALVRNGTVKLTQPLGRLRMPPTVQGILAARIDRLPTAEKDLLQTLAVVGQQAPLAVIMEIVARPRIERMLGNLQTGEFIYERALSGAAVAYEFKHALTRDVAYNSLLIERRKALHERVGAALESIYGGQLDDHVSELARHYSSSDNVAKAVEYLGRAGSQAMQRSAHGEAIKLFTSASGLVETLPKTPKRLQQQLSVQLGLGGSFMATKIWSAPEVAHALSRAREICRILGDPPQLISVLFGLNGFYVARGEFKIALELSLQLLAIGQAQQDVAILLNAHFVLGMVLFFMGEFQAAQNHLVCANSLYDPALDRSGVVYAGQDPAVHALCYQFWALGTLGYPDRATNRLQSAHNWPMRYLTRMAWRCPSSSVQWAM
jgi:predicted ATPase